VLLALTLSLIPALAFDGFVRMALVLISADLVLYVLTKLNVVS
jgi:hypothetical protein